MKAIVFYHTDNDGHLSGFLCKKFLLENDYQVKMQEIDYGWDIPLQGIDKETEVYILDFSFEPWDLMEEVHQKAKDLVWIDHHETAIDKHSKSLRQFSGTRDPHVAASRLTWNYFFADTIPETPEVVQLVANYDVFNLDFCPGIREFQNGSRLYDTNPETLYGYAFWNSMLGFSYALNNVKQKGEIVYKFQLKTDLEKIQSTGFETTLLGKKCFAANLRTNSIPFEYLPNAREYDVYLAFIWTHGHWKVSLYSDKPNINVGEMALLLGGGGHAKAAGFECANLPFELK